MLIDPKYFNKWNSAGRHISLFFDRNNSLRFSNSLIPLGKVLILLFSIFKYSNSLRFLMLDGKTLSLFCCKDSFLRF
jgi:hypothetical protein